MKNKKPIDFEKLIKKVTKEVDKWPTWKKVGIESLINHRLEPSKNHCGCGYADCNNRGF